MKKLLLLLMAAFAAITIQAQDDLPLNTTINFTQFDKAVKGIQLDGYLCTATAEDPAVYSCLFTFDNFNGALTAFNIEFYTMLTSGNDEFIPVREYEVEGKKAYLGTNNFNANGETPMNVLVVQYSELRMTIVINAETDIPVETLEAIIKKLVF